MNSSDEIKKINSEISNILEKLHEAFELMKQNDTSESEEMKRLVFVKKKIIEITDSILILYNVMVKVKYHKLEQSRIEKNNKINEVESLKENDFVDEFKEIINKL